MWLNMYLLPRRIRDYFECPDVDSHPEWCDQDRWFVTEFTPSDSNSSHEALYQYARDRLAEQRQIYDVVDTKAEKLFQFTATFAGAVFVLVKMFEREPDWLFVTAYFAFAMTLVWCVLIRRPVDVRLPMSVRKAAEMLDKQSPPDCYAWLAGTIHCAIVALELVTLWKAKRLNDASAIFVAGVLLLLAAMAKN